MTEPGSEYPSYVIEALSPHGEPEFVDAEEVADKFALGWVPCWAVQVGSRFWAIEPFAGGEVPDRIVNLANDQKANPDLSISFFVVPEAHDQAADLAAACSINGISLIMQTAGKYHLHSMTIPEISIGDAKSTAGQASTALEPPKPPVLCRIPEALACIPGCLQSMEQQFRTELVGFAVAHSHMKKANLTPLIEQALVLETLSKLFTCDKRFTGDASLVYLLSSVEQTLDREGVRDHFFHSFQVFLLGCQVIDQTYKHLRDALLEVLPGVDGCSIEFAWLLTALFHDVGYALQRRGEVKHRILGLSQPPYEEQEIMQENEAILDDFCYETAINQLASLYEHLCQSPIAEAWSGEPLWVADSPFERACRRSFIEGGHGAAGALRLAVEYVRLSKKDKLGPDQRRFAARHVYLSALSIAVHDLHFREALRAEKITSITTRRFPFGSLLTYIDALQDDRRSRVLEGPLRDTLKGLAVKDSLVSATFDFAQFERAHLYEKQKEVTDITTFFVQDGLRYDFPPQFVTH